MTTGTGGPFAGVAAVVVTILMAAAGLGICGGVSVAWAAGPEAGSEVAAPAPETVSVTPSLESTLAVEQAGVEELTTQWSKVQELERTMEATVNAYQVRISSANSVLIFPDARLEDLERAREDSQMALDEIRERLKELRQQVGQIEEQRRETLSRYDLNRKQIAETQALEAKDYEAVQLIAQLGQLSQVLASKRDLLDRIQGVYAGLITRLEEAAAGFDGLAGKLETRARERRHRELFERKPGVLTSVGWPYLRGELRALAEQVKTVASVEYWSEQAGKVWRSGGVLLVTAVILFAIFHLLILRFNRYCVYLQETSFCQGYPWRSLALRLFQRSLSLLGVVLFLYVYARVRHLYAGVPVIRASVQVLLIWLGSRWGLHFLIMWERGEQDEVVRELKARLRTLLQFARIFAVAYVVLSWLLGSGTILLVPLRVCFEVGLLVWSVPFWRRVRLGLPVWSQKKAGMVAKSAMIGLGYIVAGGGLLLELAGYGPLAAYWYTSWARTAVVLLWSSLLALVLFEWDRRCREHACTIESRSPASAGSTIRWFLTWQLWLVWFGGTVVCLPLAWGAKQAVIVGLFGALSYPLTIGGLKISVVSITHAALILLLTHLIARLWRLFLQKRILAQSGLEQGVIESITSISVYVLWGLGILIALHALGMSTASLAVAFGALGIGLGFGLQNIFNNFVSGLIILFERPIQVGDAVEINGIWGTITKINVRSTVVQTYDNASLIIPNSEFISKELTNWTFKDLRLRRNVVVGVAYGSDVTLVRDTLLEVAGAHPKVLKYPAPDVLFVDFGSSSLDFKLRFWTMVTDCLMTETEIRFEIVRLFAERKIEIPFPQRDIHLRSVAEKARIKVSPTDGEGGG